MNSEQGLLNHCRKILVIILFVIMMTLSACRDDRNVRITEKLSTAEAMLSSGKKDDALGSLLEAENDIDETVSDTLRYKILAEIGGIYYADFKKAKADLYFAKALTAARKCDNEFLSAALWNRCLSISDSDSLFVLLKECQTISRECGSRYTEAMSGISLASEYIQTEEMGKARETLEEMEDVVGEDAVLKGEFSVIQLQYYIKNKEFDIATEMLDDQDVSELNLNGKFLRYQNFYTIEIEREGYKQALSYRDSIDEIKNKVDSIAYDEKLSKIEAEFSSKLDEEREQRNIAIIVSSCVIILLAVFLVWRAKRTRMMRKQLRLNEQISKLNLRIAQLTQKYEEGSVAAIEIGPDVKDGVIEKLRLNKELFMNLPIYGRLKQLNLKRDADAIDRTAAKGVLDGVIGQFADVCSNLRQLYADMTYDDVLYCSAIYVGFSKEVASVAFGASVDALRRRKSRIKQKLPVDVFEAIFGTKT